MKHKLIQPQDLDLLRKNGIRNTKRIPFTPSRNKYADVPPSRQRHTSSQRRRARQLTEEK